ncbi:hypothetical protein [Microbulbifer sp.]|uniref:hypothetical protein n=1 Tax=Microbulbifer sp. TaxID=1908541 RepID=UPI00258F0461|nr:hypothetical protein [Microbulbifer sp.]
MNKVVFSIALIPFLTVGYIYWLNDQHNRKLVPAQLILKGTRYSNNDSLGLRESCGVHVYDLDPVMMERIKNEGIKFFRGVTQSRGHSDFHHKFGDWQNGPRKDWKKSEIWVSEVLDCSNMNRELEETVIKVGLSQSSYYSLGYEKVIMVSPDHGLVVLTHNG